MASRLLALGFALLSIPEFGVVAVNTTSCKNVPSSPLWPTPSDWSQLNSTLGGKLLAPLPPAIVCDQTHHKFSQAACEVVGQQWFTAPFHDDDPVSLHQPNWQKDGCLPAAVFNSSKACNLNPFPKYTVNASEAQHVVDAVKFAGKHNLRVSIKNTGHDYLGRSTSPEFSIWTHHLKQIESHQSFQPQGCSKVPSSPAMTINAGNQMGEIYTAAKANGVVVMGGADPSVGLGGWLTGGGHSPLGSLHGLGVDSLLELQMVTPSGDLIAANECQNSDLFWAMRGGGGSTFGVIVSATVKTFQDLPASNFTLLWISTPDEANNNNNSNFYSILADMYGYLVEWSENYMNGYFDFAKASLLGFPVNNTGPIEPIAMTFGGFFHNKTEAELNDLMAPFVKHLNSTEGLQSSFTTSQLAKGNLRCRLECRIRQQAVAEAMTDKQSLIDIFRTVGDVIAQGLVVSGPGLRESAAASMTSVNPAWRKTYLHTLVSGGWGYRNITAAQQYREYNTNVLTKALRDHAPDSGAYLNEADKYEPNWRQTFWGSNYKKLLKIKRKYDPNGVLWCVPCVGHEDWKYNDATGQLCRA